jgi:hypothetical protein
MVKSFTRPIHLATRSTICQVIRQRRFVGFIDDSATRHLLEFWKRRRGFSWWWVYQSKSQNARTKTTYTAHEHQDLYCHLYFTSIIFINLTVRVSSCVLDAQLSRGVVSISRGANRRFRLGFVVALSAFLTNRFGGVKCIIIWASISWCYGRWSRSRCWNRSRPPKQ